ncbi:MAG: pyruvate-flavodoxin oxidoreductase [Anaerolineae bacterium SM23_ 63]|nr:MAG: pyruvate-flavodoxin oxidoreductase [Anaerolineae bacterium SM23_ 63]HEY47106.1 pyruvate:ferredoxin (flavodoxin) oxidoreductase [Anaerolineae bacterium]
MTNKKAKRELKPYDGNAAAAHVGYATNEVIAIYPITPSSPMGEIADEKAALGEPNIWGTIPVVVEMQSEGGAAGAVHGALTTGALTTTFTASQGLLLMLPNMFKIAGELTPAVFHIAARSVAAQALSIFGDHSDVMAARSTGWALMSSNNIQEVMDFALIAQASALEARVPFLHFFDGFRTSHEIQKIEELTYDDMRAMIDDDLVTAHRMRGLSPDRPSIRGTAQNPDVFFAARETVNPYYINAPGIVQRAMDRFAEITGRNYHLFEYIGASDAERAVVMMGSGAETMHEVVDYMNGQGEKIGLVKVRLYRPFNGNALIEALPKTVQSIAVLDRTKEPGAAGEPLYLDVQNAIVEAVVDGRIDRSEMPLVVGGRYGLGSREFNPGMAKSVLDNLATEQPKNHFTVGIFDDLTNSNLPWDDTFSSSPEGEHRALFFGLGGDGTVGANKNSIKIIGKATDYSAQGYFVYDSKKSGSLTISHLRFSPKPIRSTYLIDQAKFLAVHSFHFLERIDILNHLRQGGTFLLNSSHPADEVWDHLPFEVQQALIEKEAKFYVIDAYSLAKSLGLGARINVIMQTAYFAISDVIPEEQAMEMMELAVEDTYGDKGKAVVDMNVKAAKLARERIHQVPVPEKATSEIHIRPPVPEGAPEFVKEVTGEMIAQRGERIPVSLLPNDGTYPTGTTRFEKRNVALEIPVWEPEACIQCNQCSFVCPHATIRPKIYDASFLNGDAPDGWEAVPAKGRGLEGMMYTLQVAPEDCTGCGNCVHICPAYVKDEEGKKTERKAINMALQAPIREQEAAKWEYFLSIPDPDPTLFNRFTTKGSQFLPTMFEFSGACAGCGETPYVKLLTQLFGDRMIIANATGCSSIFGGNLPTTPYTPRFDGRGPTWSNSLFEDNAEFGMGMRLTVDKLSTYAKELLEGIATDGQSTLIEAMKTADLSSQEAIEEQRARIEELRPYLEKLDDPNAHRLLGVIDFLVPKSVWVIGGDGWGYDIGYGGLDHVLASGRDVNVLLLDTGVYSNTGGQASKATPRAAVAKFAAAGKDMPKKDLGAIAMTYGNIYVAQVAYGENMTQLVKAFREAEAYPGPALIIAYSHCIAHGIDMTTATDLHKDAVATGFWPLFRFDPTLAEQGKNPLQLDSKTPTENIEEFMYKQNRFRSLRQANPERANMLLEAIRQDVITRWKFYEQMANLDI